MKDIIFKLICCSYLLIFGTISSQAQATINVSTTYNDNEAFATITVDNINNLLGFQLSLNWNPEELIYTEIIPNESIGILPYVYVNDLEEGMLALYYSSLTAESIVLNNESTVLLTINFKVQSANPSDVQLSNFPTHIELIDEDFEIIPIDIQNGININTSYIVGHVYFDENMNCSYDSTELQLSGWQVELDGGQIYSTNTDGRYVFYVPQGIHTLRLIPPNELWEGCEDSFTVDVGESIFTQHLGSTATIACAQLEVDVETPFLRRCFDNFYTINYQNTGTIPSENAYIEVELDPYLTYVSSSITPTQIDGNLLRFDVAVLPYESKSFKIRAYLDCENTILGQTHCTEAIIYPHEPCGTPPPLWSGANIELDAECQEDSLVFYIWNNGTGDMLENSVYVIIEDDVIMRTETAFQLPAGKALTVRVPANGSTYRLEADQVEYHPYPGTRSIAIEGCSTNDLGEISTGYVLQFPAGVDVPYQDLDCRENIGSYDPNDKQGFPKGYGDMHYIDEITPLDYLIRFQNTGTDTAFNIVVRDTLTSYLNASSLRIKSYSHPMRYTIEDQVVSFYFDNILLPDSTTNEAESHGFVRFNIQQNFDNQVGTSIENNAAIYFDFNEPIITNTTIHRIGRDFVSVYTSLDPIITQDPLNVYPNPFTTKTNFELPEEIGIQNLHLFIYDINGQIVYQTNFKERQLEWYTTNLAKGIYFFEIRKQQQLLYNGKLLAQ